jgi:His-Xaa-Ser repeat protein HxsA
MKAYVLLAALTLAVPADSLAGKRHHHHGGHYSGSRCYTGHYGGYHGGYYGGYRSSSYCYRPSYSYYRPYAYSYSPYYYSSYVPAVSFSYTSAPRTYYRSSDYAYGNDSSLEVDVQRALKRRGYYRGGLDGDIGPASRAAIRAYQSEHGLAINGRIDSALLRSLGI